MFDEFLVAHVGLATPFTDGRLPRLRRRQAPLRRRPLVPRLARHHAARGRPGRPARRRLGRPRSATARTTCSNELLRARGHRAVPRLGAAARRPRGARHPRRRRVVVAQRPEVLAGVRPGAALRRRRRRRRRRRARASPASRRPTCSSPPPSGSASPPADAVVVEDAVSGVAAGRAGGFGLVVGVDRGAGHEALAGQRRRPRRRRPRRARADGAAAVRTQAPDHLAAAPLPDRPVAARRAGVRRRATSA